MQAQLARWRRGIAGGAARVGWKIGFNSPAAQRQLGLDGTVVGHLTQTTVLAPGASHSLAGSHLVIAEPEVAIHLGRDVPRAPTEKRHAPRSLRSERRSSS